MTSVFQLRWRTVGGLLLILALPALNTVLLAGHWLKWLAGGVCALTIGVLAGSTLAIRYAVRVGGLARAFRRWGAITRGFGYSLAVVNGVLFIAAMRVHSGADVEELIALSLFGSNVLISALLACAVFRSETDFGDRDLSYSTDLSPVLPDAQPRLFEAIGAICADLGISVPGHIFLDMRPSLRGYHSVSSNGVAVEGASLFLPLPLMRLISIGEFRCLVAWYLYYGHRAAEEDLAAAEAALVDAEDTQGASHESVGLDAWVLIWMLLSRGALVLWYFIVGPFKYHRYCLARIAAYRCGLFNEGLRDALRRLREETFWATAERFGGAWAISAELKARTLTAALGRNLVPDGEPINVLGRIWQRIISDHSDLEFAFEMTDSPSDPEMVIDWLRRTSAVYDVDFDACVDLAVDVTPPAPAISLLELPHEAIEASLSAYHFVVRVSEPAD